ISLHAPSQKIRETIMPVSRTYAFDDLIDTCRFYTKNSRRQLFFEYALIAGTNDSPESAHVLSRLINSDRLFYLNLIPLNQVKDGLTPAGNDSLDKFCRILEDNHVNFSVRHSFGQSINSACGQLIVDSAGISA
ncbi:MAG TPA: 23S rRNA (adenine(2503)-C(2))-methyltransferase RlmN, partial [Patescibacteria group bacterium]